MTSNYVGPNFCLDFSIKIGADFGALIDHVTVDFSTNMLYIMDI